MTSRYCLTGVFLGLGAPAGWLLLRIAAKTPFTSSGVLEEITTNGSLYAYLLVSTCLVFGAFGYVLGRKNDLVVTQNALLSEASITDVLTGLFNRRHLMEFLVQAMAESVRYEQPMALIMLDIDRFKSINDRYGHQAGDEVLRGVARSMLECKRQSDIAARFGGEEFVLVLPQTGVDEASLVAERLRQSIAAVGVEWEGAAMTITCSCGVVGGQVRGSDSVDEIIRSADEALYVAKHGGRNRVASHALE